MKNPIYINTSSYPRPRSSGLGKKYYMRAALVLPVICLVAFTGCSSLDATAGNQTTQTNRVGVYLQHNQEEPNKHPVDSDPDPTYEWFY
jgi:hypothetical protein